MDIKQFKESYVRVSNEGRKYIANSDLISDLLIDYEPKEWESILKLWRKADKEIRAEYNESHEETKQVVRKKGMRG